MARGSRPGERRGGRAKGTPNRRTFALRQGLVTVGAPPDAATSPPRQQPLEFLLNVMEDESHPIATRVDAAKAAAPYVHFRKGLIDTNGRDVPLVVQVIRFSDMTSELEPVTIEHDSNEAA